MFKNIEMLCKRVREMKVGLDGDEEAAGDDNLAPQDQHLYVVA